MIGVKVEGKYRKERKPRFGPFILSYLWQYRNYELRYAMGIKMKKNVMRVFYNQPATNWEDTFLIGNVKMSALIKGAIKRESLYLNNENQLDIEFEHSEVVGQYERELSLDTAIVTVSYEIDHIAYKREYFAVFSDEMIVVRYSCNTTKLSCKICQDPSVGDNQIKLLTCDGKVKATLNEVEIQSATTLVFVITKNNYEGKKEPYETLLTNHLKAYQNKYEAIDLYLGKQINIPTNVRLKRLLEGQIDKGLYGLFFQYTRYLMLLYFQQKDSMLYYQNQSSWMNLIFGWFLHTCNLLSCTKDRYEIMMPSLIEQWKEKNPYERTLAELGWMVIELFWHYEFTKNLSFLKNVAYPMVETIIEQLTQWQENYPMANKNNDTWIEQVILKEAIQYYHKMCTMLQKKPSASSHNKWDYIIGEQKPYENKELHEEWMDYLLLREAILTENKKGIYSTLNQLLAKCITKNCYIKCSKDRLATFSLFSLGIATMIVQDWGTRLKFFPALSEVFNVGYVNGLRIRENRTMYLSWKNGALIKCEVIKS